MTYLVGQTDYSGDFKHHNSVDGRVSLLVGWLATLVQTEVP